MTENPFDDERLQGARSALVKVLPDDQGRYIFELMCQYTRKGLDNLQVGDLIGIENYTPTSNEDRVYSVLAISQVYPVHFAAQGSNAYPGHIFESMRSIKEDWESQEDRPMHLTTTISIQAVPTGYQFSFNSRSQNGLPGLAEEKNLPMIGAEIRPLSMDMVNAIINQGVSYQPDSPLQHKKFEELNVKLDQESLLTTHFGIFGFTGVGKSNLVSSMVTSLCFENEKPLSNFIIMDPNDEYLGLFIDRFMGAPEEVSYIHIGSDSLHNHITRGLGDDSVEPSDEVLTVLRHQLRLPPPVQDKYNNDGNFKERIDNALRNVFRRTRIVLPFDDVAFLIRKTIREQTDERTGPEVKEAMRQIVESWATEFFEAPVNKENLEKAVYYGNHELDLGPVNSLNPSKKGNAQGIIRRTTNILNAEASRLKQIPPEAIIQISDLINRLSDRDNRQTIIVTGRRDSDIKHFSAMLGNNLYESRRHMVERHPFITFIFDEADLFIPQSGSDDDTLMVRELCVTLARRGRKFGLGLGISTQRSSMLDTEVMSNLHTYFVSKLPRADDRKRVAEAFGIGENQLTPTFTFRKGNWLVISHDATGLKGVPIPTSAADANVRISGGS